MGQLGNYSLTFRRLIWAQMCSCFFSSVILLYLTRTTQYSSPSFLARLRGHICILYNEQISITSFLIQSTSYLWSYSPIQCYNWLCFHHHHHDRYAPLQQIHRHPPKVATATGSVLLVLTGSFNFVLYIISIIWIRNGVNKRKEFPIMVLNGVMDLNPITFWISNSWSLYYL